MGGVNNVDFDAKFAAGQCGEASQRHRQRRDPRFVTVSSYGHIRSCFVLITKIGRRREHPIDIQVAPRTSQQPLYFAELLRSRSILRRLRDLGMWKEGALESIWDCKADWLEIGWFCVFAISWD